MKTLIALAAAAAAFGAAPALTRDPTPAPRIKIVHYADLDLASTAGRSVLDRRILAAVDEVCGTASDADLHGKNVVQRCRTETAKAAAAQRSAALALAARSRSGQLASGR